MYGVKVMVGMPVDANLCYIGCQIETLMPSLRNVEDAISQLDQKRKIS